MVRDINENVCSLYKINTILGKIPVIRKTTVHFASFSCMSWE